MEYGIHLPSNASPLVYPDNTTSHYVTELAQRMELHGDWQACLIEISYPNTIAQVLQGENEITLQADGLVDQVSVRPGSYGSQKDFIQAVKDALEAYENNVSHSDIITVKDDDRVVLEPLSHEGTVTFSPRLALQLGLYTFEPLPAHEPILGVKAVDVCLGMPSELYVYLDILADQIVGHARSPLLRTVPVDIHAPYGSLTRYHCEHPLYVDVSTKSFGTLKTDIKDSSDRHIPFDYGTSNLLVHFRRKWMTR